MPTKITVEKTQQELRFNSASTDTEQVSVGLPTGTYENGLDTSSIGSNQNILPAKVGDEVFEITKKAKEYLSNPENSSQVEQVSKLQNVFKNILRNNENNLPKIKIFLAGDSSIMVSLMAEKMNLFVNIFSDESDSSWGFVSGETRGHHADGYLNDPSFNRDFPYLLDLFIKAESKK